MNTVQKSHFAEQEQALKRELVRFYNQCRELFVGLIPRSTAVELLPAAMESDDHEHFITFDFMCFEAGSRSNPSHVDLLSFFWGLDEGTPPDLVNTFIVNEASYLFERSLKNHQGFELPLLHEMIHIKYDMEQALDFKHLFGDNINYAKACHLLAAAYPITDKKGNPTALWSKDDLLHIRCHDINFMAISHHIAKKLLKQEELLTRVLDGRVLEGNDTWEKEKWLALQLYRPITFSWDDLY